MAEALTGVNGKIIRWAREYYNMTPDEAAIAIGVDLPRYIGWEEGTEYPTYAKLKKISDVFHKPSAVFFLPEPPNIPSVRGDLRTLPNEVVNKFSKNVIMQLEKAKVYQFNLRELYGNKKSIIADRGTFPKNTDQLCEFLREKMEFPISSQKARKSTKEVFNYFRDKFYDLGIYVFKDAFKDDRVSGISMNDDYFPVIIINNSMSYARQVFTLFHELYHLISDSSGVEIIRDDYYSELNRQQADAEHACDNFANAFLVPAEDFRQELQKKPIDDERIVELSKIYSVSKEAIMYKLLMMKIISSEDYNRLKETFYGEAIREKKKSEGKKSGGNHYNTKLTYLRKNYTGDVFKLYFSGRIDSTHASDLLQTKVDHLPNLETVYFRGVSR